MAEKTFEKALERLEEIVKMMEEGDMTLGGSLKAFEEGINLSRFCAKKLDDAERKVEMLVKRDGEETVVPFVKEDETNE
jgi:exodeoxyribonuclease VII small subunit